MSPEKAALGFRKALRYDHLVSNALAPHVSGRRVLSVGCGEGRAEQMLQQRLGVDIWGVEVTRYKEQKIQVKLYDGKRLPFSAGEFDTTLFIYMLHHSDDIERLLREAMRVTRGSILILDHTYTNRISRALLKAYDYWSNCLYKMPIPYNFLKVREWLSLFGKLGLEVEEASIPSPMNIFFKLRMRGVPVNKKKGSALWGLFPRKKAQWKRRGARDERSSSLFA